MNDLSDSGNGCSRLADLIHQILDPSNELVPVVDNSPFAKNEALNQCFPRPISAYDRTLLHMRRLEDKAGKRPSHLCWLTDKKLFEQGWDTLLCFRSHAPSDSTLEQLWQWLSTLSEVDITADALEEFRKTTEYRKQVERLTAATPVWSVGETRVSRSMNERFGITLELRDSYIKAYGRILNALHNLLHRNCKIFVKLTRQYLCAGNAPRDWSDVDSHIRELKRRKLDQSAFFEFWSSLANVASDGGKHILAYRLYRRAFAAGLKHSLGQFERPDFVDALVNAGVSLFSAGKHKEGLAELDDAKNHIERLLGTRCRYYSHVLGIIGTAKMQAGSLKEAEDLLFRAIEIWEQSRSTSIDGHLLPPVGAFDALSHLLHETGDHSRAAKLSRAYQNFVEDGSRFERDVPIERLLSIATSATVKDLREKISDIELRFGVAHPDTVPIRATMATELESLGRYGEALKAINEAIGIVYSHFGDSHHKLADLYLKKSQLLLTLDDAGASWDALKKADAVTRNDAGGKSQLTRIRILSAQAIILLRSSLGARGFKAAWQCATEAHEIIIRLFQEYREVEERRLLQVNHAHYGLIGLFFTIYLQGLGDPGISVAFLLEKVWQHKNRVVDQIRRKQSKGIPADQARRKMDYLKKCISGRITAREFVEMDLGISAMQWTVFQSLVKEDHEFVGIEFMLWNDVDGTSRYSAFVVTSEPSIRFVDLGIAATIDACVDDFLTSIREKPNKAQAPNESHARDFGWENNGSNSASFTDTSQALFQAVFGPLQLPCKLPQNLTIAVDGHLALAPLEAMLFEEGSFLDDHCAVTYVGSLWEVTRFRRRQCRASEAFVIGNPNFNAPASSMHAVPDSRRRVAKLLNSQATLPWRQLPGTNREVGTVAELLGVSSCVADEATTDRFIEGSRSVLVHVATHGFVLEGSDVSFEDSPLAFLETAGLVFAGANRMDTDDALGILTAADIGQLSMESTELLVLSACQTGAGRPLQGEGVLGLRRACWAAGVQTMLLSLWSVPDESTADLMKEFYTHLATGMSCIEALRNARRSLRDRKAPALAWAPFVLQGNPSPVFAVSASGDTSNE